MRKVFYSFIILFLLLSLNSCKQFLDDIEETLSYWASTVFINGKEIPAPVTDEDGYPCLESDNDKIIKLKLANPKCFTLKFPSDPGAPSDIITFEDGVKGKNGGSPQYNIDYELNRISPFELQLVFKKDFLEKSECSIQNLNPTITLYNTDGRKFKSYTFKLRCNTAPVMVEETDIKIGKTTETSPCYVFCFKLKDSNKTQQQDIKALCFKVDGTEYTRYLSVSPSGVVTPISTIGNYALVNRSNVTDLAPGNMPASITADTLPSGIDVICLKTDMPVVTNGGGVEKKFELWLKDNKSLKSQVRQKSTYGFKLEAPKIFTDSSMSPPLDSGVYTKQGNPLAVLNGGLPDADGSTEAKAIPIYSAYGKDVKLNIKKPVGGNYLTGVVINVNVTYVSGTPATPIFTQGSGGPSGTPATVTLPAVDNTVYKLETWAEGGDSEPSDKRTLYYRVLKEVNGNTDASVPTWGILKKAVEEKTADGGTVIVSGTIKSTDESNNSGQIEINKNITIKGRTGAAKDILDANSKNRIFKLSSANTLTIENLTLQRGKVSGSGNDGLGGAVFVYGGGKLNLINVNMKNNEAKLKGGAVFVQENSGSSDSELTVKGGEFTDNKAIDTFQGGGGAFAIIAAKALMDGVKIKQNFACRGAGIYVDISSSYYASKITLKCSNEYGVTEIIDNGTTDSSTAANGGGIYFCGGNLNIGAGVKINKNKAQEGGGVYLINASSCNISADSGSSISEISENTALLSGAGVFMNGSSESANFTMNGGKISDNSVLGPDGKPAGYGGGIYTEVDAKISINGGLIENNQARQGGAVFITANTNTFSIKNSAQITPSTEGDKDKPGKNDVYLGTGLTIEIEKHLTADGQMARITPENYTQNTPVLEAAPGVDLANEVNKFVVTPNIGGTTEDWTIDSNGLLQPK